MAYRLLIVDDSPAMRSFVKRVIQASGLDAKCFEASNGREALALLGAEWVDAILTDINMPDMDGEEFLRTLATDDVLKNTPSLVISTDATPQRIARMRALGARGYLSKPFLPEDLRGALERIFGGTDA